MNKIKNILILVVAFIATVTALAREILKAGGVKVSVLTAGLAGH